MSARDEPFQERGLDDQLDALADEVDQRPATATDRAYRSLARLYAQAAGREADAIERVRQRLTAQLSAPTAQPEQTGRLAERSFIPEVRQVPEPLDTPPAFQARQVRPLSRRRKFLSGAAAALAVGFLLGGFLAVLHVRQAGPASNAYHWRVISSPNTPLAVNALTGITVRTTMDAWAWGVANVAPDNVNSNPIQTPLVEHWDGQQWRIVATPPPPEGGQLTDIVALAADDAWAVGQQLTGGTENTSNAPLVEHWNGHQWAVVQDDVSYWPNGSSLVQLAALATNDIWAVGEGGGDTSEGLIQHWDGRSWHTVAHPSPPGSNRFSAIAALAPNDIWVAGEGGRVFEHWNGSQWTVVAAASPSTFGLLPNHATLNALSVVATNDVWAAGVESPAIPFPNGAVPLFEHWDGHTWSVVSGPSLTGSISGIAALGPNDVWAVGLQNFGMDTGQVGQGLIEHWDGQRWSLVENPTPQPFTQLSGIAGDPTTPGKLWVVGTTGPTHDGDQLFVTRTLIETMP